jgi:hypothetical protein
MPKVVDMAALFKLLYIVGMSKWFSISSTLVLT